MIEFITSSMLKNSDAILTVSKSSMEDLVYFYNIGKDFDKTFEIKGISIRSGLDKSKVAIVGTGIDADLLNIIVHQNKEITKKKDIDFLCMGRIEKFFLIEKIWMKIKALRPDSNLVMIGRASPEVIDKLLSIGIEHKGFVTEKEKMDLYSRAKVFIFPSSREGFGIAVAEALFLHIPVVAWKIPVFDELYSKNNEMDIKLVEFGNPDLFVEQCIKTVNQYDLTQSSEKHKKSNIVFPTWKTVAQNVISIIEYTQNKS
jgi:glycosyltransferase involved in cell wall biosynthesis